MALWLRPQIDEHVVRIQGAVLAVEVVGIQAHQLRAGRDDPAHTGLGPGAVVVGPRPDCEGPARDVEIRVTQPQRLTDADAGVEQQGKQQPIPQMLTRVEDRLNLFGGKEFRPQPRLGECDRAPPLGFALGHMV